MNRPLPVKTDNFFLLIFRALRHRRVPIALRIASHNVILVALALVIYACVMGLQFKQAMHQQAGGDWPRFYDAVRALARLPAAQRQAALCAALPPTSPHPDCVRHPD